MTIEEVRPLAFKKGNGYVVRSDEKVILVDTGIGGKFKTIERTLASMGLDCTDIELVILTHTHYDHVGNVAACTDLSGAPVLVHAAEAQVLRDGYSGFPGGATRFGRFMVGLVKGLGLGGASFEPVEPEIVLGAEEDPAGSDVVARTAPGSENVTAPGAEGEGIFDLHRYGFPGIAVHTPSHSPGSISVLAEDGSCFPGDILFNIFPGSLMPPFADNPELLARHWRELLDRGAARFYPGHGKPFGRARVEATLAKLEVKAAKAG